METEIKLAVRDAEEAARRLEAAGAVLRSPRALEDNRLFDLADRRLTGEGRLLRVRETAGRVVVTAKAPAPASDPRYKIRREAEVEVPDAEAFVAMLAVAGFEPLWRYQKYRRAYDWDGTEVVVDETPAGAFLEVEGEPAAIERVVTRLGDAAGPRLTASYHDVWVAVCARDGREAGDMLFGADAERTA